MSKLGKRSTGIRIHLAAGAYCSDYCSCIGTGQYQYFTSSFSTYMA